MGRCDKIIGKKVKLMEQRGALAHLKWDRQSIGSKMAHFEQRDDTLAGRLKAGSRTAAAEFVDNYYEQLYLYMRRLGHGHEISEDLVQESFLQAWQHISQLRNGKGLKNWLYRIAGNASRLYWRRHKDKMTYAAEANDVADACRSQDEIEHREQLERLQKAVFGLPAKQREAVVLHYMQHLTITEAADAAGIREGTFKSRLNRGLTALRKQIGKSSGKMEL